jgi:hypothetical protein
MEISLEISASRERGLLDPYFTRPKGVSEPVLKDGEFLSSCVLSDFEGLGVER